jgi:hypothetical protein
LVLRPIKDDAFPTCAKLANRIGQPKSLNHTKGIGWYVILCVEVIAE